MLLCVQCVMMVVRRVSLVASGSRKVTVSGCDVVSWVMGEVFDSLCIAFCMALEPGRKSSDILNLVICLRRSLFMSRSALPLALLRVLLAVVMSRRRCCRFVVDGSVGEGKSGEPCVLCFSRALMSISDVRRAAAVVSGGGVVCLVERWSMWAWVWRLSVRSAESSLFRVIIADERNGLRGLREVMP